jgi:hypothetical protein
MFTFRKQKFANTQIMKQSLLYLSLCLLSTSSVFAQDEVKSDKKKIAVREFHLLNGSVYNSPLNSTYADFQALAPNSGLLKNDFSSFGSMDFSFGRPQSNKFHAFYIGLQLSDKEKTGFIESPRLRLGLIYSNTKFLSRGLYKTENTPYDTLTSSQTGEQFFIDSIYSQTYFMDHSVEQLKLDAALIFRSNDDYRFSLHAGIGAMAGMTVRSVIDIAYEESRTATYGNNSNDSYTRTTENFTSRNGFAGALYIPFGMNLRLGKNREFWKHVNLYMESRASMNFVAVPELKTFTTFGLSNSLGLKITW